MEEGSPSRAEDELASPAEQRISVPRPPFRHLIVGYDGSDGANAAAAFALWLAGHVRAKVTAVHASPTPKNAASSDLLAGAAAQVVAQERDWQRRLDNLREYAATHTVVESRVVRGRPASVILSSAIDAGADLVLMGSHGVGRVREALLGSVSSEVLHHAVSSVMLFPEPACTVPASHARTIVVGVDRSMAGQHALRLAEALAVPLGASLVVVHAYAPGPVATHPTAARREDARRRAAAVLHDARGTITARLDDIEERLVEGGAVEALITECAARKPALLVVGHGGERARVRRLLLGGTARRLANGAPCPILVARELDASGTTALQSAAS